MRDMSSLRDRVVWSAPPERRLAIKVGSGGNASAMRSWRCVCAATSTALVRCPVSGVQCPVSDVRAPPTGDTRVRR